MKKNIIRTIGKVGYSSNFVIIPKEYSDHLDWKAGDNIIFTVIDDHLKLKKLTIEEDNK